MAESSLSLGYSDFIREISMFLGWGSSPTGDRLTECQRILARGYRQFLYPPPVDQSGRRHEWSFLTPQTTLSITADTAAYDLPDNFGSMVGAFTWGAESGKARIIVCPEGQVEAARSMSDRTGTPTHVAVRPKTSDGTTGQRFEAIFYPTPESNDTLYYRYYVKKDALSESYPYPVGGPEHAETLLESCLAVAESQKDDEMGIHRQAFMDLLRASITHDQSIAAPEHYGYNRDDSDNEPMTWARSNYVTYNGSLPS
jgi:hypothetical protein